MASPAPWFHLWACLGIVLCIVAIPVPPTSTPETASSGRSYYPSPRSQPDLCGHPEAGPGWVCDPGRVLQEKTVLQANAIIDEIRNQTKCPCRRVQCHGEFYGGYKIGVTVVRGLQSANNLDSDRSSSIAQGFADDIRRSRWRYGTCSEDIVLLLSIDEDRIYVSAGDTAQHVFHRVCVYETITFFRQIVRQTNIGDYDQGLLQILQKMKSTFVEQRPCGHSQSIVQWWHMIIVGLGLICLMFFMVGLVFLIRRRLQNRNA